jgi:hypothetical protein
MAEGVATIAFYEDLIERLYEQGCELHSQCTYCGGWETDDFPARVCLHEPGCPWLEIERLVGVPEDRRSPVAVRK